MSTFGMQIMNESGFVTLDTSKQTWSYAGYFEAPANVSTTRTFPHVVGMTLIAQQHLLNDLPMNQKVITHTLSVSGNSVTASGGNKASIVVVLAQ